MGSVAETDTKYTTGVILAVTQKPEGEYEVNQVEGQDRIPPPPGGNTELGSRRYIEYDKKPVYCKGYYEPSSFQISIQIHILGVNIGSYTSNLNNVSLSISININSAKGRMKCYRHNNDVRVQIEIRNKPGHGDQQWQWDDRMLN
ncbi:hypothetical protein G647_07219 [Cladophialophora carrionii CBS 160.54]|uniref:Uncharacterized protein n=1 Tax=Cladophialophora carrionii CBS 160.54 TaxID=1279043 RepID=V9D2P0_9EURO|nr:uncharacterized protein G647_07219 [Cladophialophora carrionii CBS 160.54]ETI20876.1 hypothetical protein G647_07219 [Cladophialophora carrionii CBS 160.54]